MSLEILDSIDSNKIAWPLKDDPISLSKRTASTYCNEFHKSTISPVTPPQTKALSQLSFPELMPPTGLGNPMWRLITLHEELESELGAQVTLSESEIKDQMTQMKESELERKKLIHEYEKQEANRQSWSTVANFFEGVAGVSACCAGIAAGGWIGPLLIGAGALQIGSQAIKNTIQWEGVTAYFIEDEKRQKSIAKTIEMSLSGVSLVAGLASGAWAYKTGALTLQTVAHADTIRKVGQVVSSISTIGGAAANLKESWGFRQISLLQGELKKIETRITIYRNQLSQISGQTGNMLGLQSDMTRNISQMINQ